MLRIKRTREKWLPIPGYENLYSVSDYGRVYSTPRCGSKGGIRKTPIYTTGYPSILLSKNGKQKGYSVHALVLLAFIGPPPSGYECCHIDGNRANSRLDNLRYDTRKGNFADKVAHGTWQGGENNAAAKLKWEDIPTILWRVARGETYRAVAKDYYVTGECIGMIARRATWVRK